MILPRIIRWTIQNRKKLLWSFAVLLSLILLCILIRGDRKLIRAQTAQSAAARWETADKHYAQATAYLQPDSGFTLSDIPAFRLDVEHTAADAGTASDSYPWLYAASCSTSARLACENTACDVELTLIAGDYFSFHPLTVRDGWYMDEDDVMHDRIVLDRQTAWNLFYSDNVAGLYCELNGQPYQVAAVVEMDSDRCSKIAAGETCRAWVFADSPGITDQIQFTCIETVLPQPVSGYAVSTLQKVLESRLPSADAVMDNSGRFSLLNRWSVLRTLSARSINPSGIIYPWFENAARLTESRLALRLIPETLLVLIPAVSLLLLLLILNRRRTWGLHSIRDAAESLVDRRNTRLYEQKLAAKELEKEMRQADIPRD